MHQWLLHRLLGPLKSYWCKSKNEWFCMLLCDSLYYLHPFQKCSVHCENETETVHWRKSEVFALTNTEHSDTGIYAYCAFLRIWASYTVSFCLHFLIHTTEFINFQHSFLRSSSMLKRIRATAASWGYVNGAPGFRNMWFVCKMSEPAPYISTWTSDTNYRARTRHLLIAY